MESPEERIRDIVVRGVKRISAAFAGYMEWITILPAGYERWSVYRSLIMDGGRRALIIYPYLLETVIRTCGDNLSEMQAYASAPYVSLPSPYNPYDPVLTETTRNFVRTYLIPRWRERKFRGRPLVLKDLGERELKWGLGYYIVFGIIYTPRDSKIRKALFEIFASAGREYALHLLSAVTGGRISVGSIRRILILEEEIAERLRTEMLKRIAERRRRVIEECVIPSLPVKWWVDVLSDYLQYANLMGFLSEEDVRDLREKIREKLLEGGERLYSAWQQWKEYASVDVHLFQSVFLILDLLSSVDGFEELVNRMEFAMKKVRGESLNIFKRPAEEGAEICVHALREILSSDDLMDAFIRYGLKYPWEEEYR